MKTTIEKKFEIDQPIEKVWNFLSDPSQVVVCVPGASLTEKVDEQNYKGKVSMKFGPVKANYDGDIEIQELDFENKKMVLNGKGLDAKGKGSADMIMVGQLEEIPAGTAVTYTMDVSITGKLAQFGARLVNDVTEQVLKQFISNFKAELSGANNDEAGEEDNTLNAGDLIGSMVKDKLSGIFGGKKDNE